jgi:hypothetical protein
MLYIISHTGGYHMNIRKKIKISIIGAGFVGATSAYALMMKVLLLKL